MPLPRALEPQLRDYLATQQEKHRQALASGCGEVHLPESLGRKYPNACREWIWQYLFASATLCPHPRTGKIARYHLHEDSMARQLKQAVTKAAVAKRATCHTLRHYAEFPEMPSDVAKTSETSVESGASIFLARHFHMPSMKAQVGHLTLLKWLALEQSRFWAQSSRVN